MDSDVDGDEQEERIAALFRDAASGAPPPGFDAGQVVATSRRITRRRRSAAAGAALAVLAVVGVGAVAGLGGPGDATVTTASGQAADQAGNPGGGSAAGSGDAARAAAVPPVGTPLGPGAGDCADRQDPALRALVEQALPEVVGASEAATTLECRPGGERGVALEVDDGVLTVTYLPPGPVTEPSTGAWTATASGGTVVVSSRATRSGDPAPFADRLAAVAGYLAPRL